MRIKESIQFLLNRPHPRYPDRNMTKYYIAKELGCRPIMIDNWLNGKITSMSDHYIARFKDVFNIEIENGQRLIKVVGGELKYD